MLVNIIPGVVEYLSYYLSLEQTAEKKAPINGAFI
jgi:hypothetical protein